MKAIGWALLFMLIGAVVYEYGLRAGWWNRLAIVEYLPHPWGPGRRAPTPVPPGAMPAAGRPTLMPDIGSLAGGFSPGPMVARTDLAVIR